VNDTIALLGTVTNSQYGLNIGYTKIADFGLWPVKDTKVSTTANNASLSRRLQAMRLQTAGRQLGNLALDADSSQPAVTPTVVSVSIEGSTPTVTEENNPSCFSGDSLIATKHGSVPMARLSVGDVVRTAAGLQPVLSFIHHGSGAPVKLLQIIHDQGMVEMSSNHILHLVDGRDLPARDIRIGDELAGAAGASRVKHIATVQKSSWMAPLTQSGTLMVGGVTTSSYVQENDTPHWVAHFGFAPVRFLTSVFSSIHRVANFRFQTPVVKPLVIS
jgi:hypothetical protein